MRKKKNAMMNAICERFGCTIETAQDISCTYRFATFDGGIDMVVSDDAGCSLYEIKHSKLRNERQLRRLQNVTVLVAVQEHFGNIKSRNVLYLGEDAYVTDSIGTINYINAESFLLNM